MGVDGLGYGGHLSHALTVLSHCNYYCNISTMGNLRPSSTATYLKYIDQSNLSLLLAIHFFNSVLLASVYSAKTIFLNLALALMTAWIVGPAPKFRTESPLGTTKQKDIVYVTLQYCSKLHSYAPPTPTQFNVADSSIVIDGIVPSLFITLHTCARGKVIGLSACCCCHRCCHRRCRHENRQISTSRHLCVL